MTFLQEPVQIGGWAGLVVGVLAIAAGALTSLVTGSKNASKFAGAIEATVTRKFEAYDKDIERLELADRDQWKAIDKNKRECTEHGERLAKVEGQLGVKR